MCLCVCVCMYCTPTRQGRQCESETRSKSLESFAIRIACHYRAHLNIHISISIPFLPSLSLSLPVCVFPPLLWDVQWVCVWAISRFCTATLSHTQNWTFLPFLFPFFLIRKSDEKCYKLRSTPRKLFFFSIGKNQTDRYPVAIILRLYSQM